MAHGDALDRELVWGWVAEERRALADRLELLSAEQWDEPSLCGGWRVREVLAHLVWLAEYSRRRMLLDAVTHLPAPNRHNDRVARRLAREHEPAELLQRLRAAAGGRFVVPPLPPDVALGEVLTHGADMTQPLGAAPRPADERLRAVLAAYPRIWFAFGVPRRTRALRLVPTDADWRVGPAGGPELRGPGESLLLAIAGRRPALDGVAGPGVDLLR